MPVFDFGGHGDLMHPPTNFVGLNSPEGDELLCLVYCGCSNSLASFFDFPSYIVKVCKGDSVLRKQRLNCGNSVLLVSG